jgi:hypothetical protein
MTQGVFPTGSALLESTWQVSIWYMTSEPLFSYLLRLPPNLRGNVFTIAMIDI